MHPFKGKNTKHPEGFPKGPGSLLLPDLGTHACRAIEAEPLALAASPPRGVKPLCVTEEGEAERKEPLPAELGSEAAPGGGELPTLGESQRLT